SSRRRHTRFSSDWSSDVCSSDLSSLYRTSGSCLATSDHRGGSVVSTTSVPIARKRRIKGVGLFLILFLMALVFLIPFGIVAFTSVKSQGELIMGGVLALPKQFRWSNFVRAWEIGKFGIYF